MRRFAWLERVLICLFLSGILTACQPHSQHNGSHSHKPTPSSLNNLKWQELVWDTRDIAIPKPPFTPNPNPQIFYYQANGEPSTQAVKGGFYRQILGTSPDGRTVAQDFYQDTQKPQTAPFLIVPNGNSQSFDNTVLDSDMVWYDSNGEIVQTAVFKSGTPQGWLNVYEHNQLVMQLQDSSIGINMRFFSRDEQIWGEAQLRQTPDNHVSLNQLTLFHPNGQVMSEVSVDLQGKPKSVVTYDPQGKPAAAEQNAQNNQILLRRFAYLIGRLPQLMKRT